jgi:RNA polymerase sigma-70 factor, ECF subfamily
VLLMPRDPQSMEYGDNGELFADASGQEGVADWAILVESVRRGDSAGMEQLYFLFERGVRFYLFRRLGQQELDDKVHDVFLIVVQAIQRGEVREPERLMGFVRTIVRRQVASHIGQVIQERKEEQSLEGSATLADRKSTPEETAIGEEQNQLMCRILKALSARDREILTRFYLREESQEKICAEMRLSDTQFRLLKSRAKARFGELGRRRIESTRQQGPSKPRNIFMRTLDRIRY